MASKVLHAYGAMLRDPDSLGETAGEYARIAAQVAKDANWREYADRLLAAVAARRTSAVD